MEHLAECDLYLQECDLCHDVFAIEQIKVDKSGKLVYCHKCSRETKNGNTEKKIEKLLTKSETVI